MAGQLMPLGPEALDAALNALLAEYPKAFIAAINTEGAFVPLPESVVLTHQRELMGNRAGRGLADPARRA
jgi:hypothetical protein